MLRAYPADPTVDAGGTLVLHVATDAPRFRVQIERWSDGCERILDAGPFEGVDGVPGAAGADWAWPRIEVPLPDDLRGGAYIARFREEGGTTGRGAPRDDTPDARWGTALFVVRTRPSARVLVNLPLFTYHAYNTAHLDLTRRDADGASLAGGAAAVTLHRPGGGTGGHVHDETVADVYDRTTPRQTFAHWDLYALAWFAREGIAVDVCTDLDLHRGTASLDRYAVLCTFGHDAYWTREQRAHVEAWVDDGGQVAFCGAGTCRSRVQYDEATATLTADGVWADDEREDTLTGATARSGGVKWRGTRPPAGYRIEDASHWLLRDAHVRDGDLVGAGAYLIGYACDGVDVAHAPPGLRVLGRAPFSGWNVADGSGAIEPGGHAAMVAFPRGRGHVFNAGTVDWARALAWDARVKAITRSVLRRFCETGGA